MHLVNNNTVTQIIYKGCIIMSGTKKTKMSSALKTEIAKELGVYDVVKSEGWGGVTSRDCGNIVTKAIEIAEKAVNKSSR